MGSAFHQLCPRYSGTLTPTAPTAIRLWDTFTFTFTICLMLKVQEMKEAEFANRVDVDEVAHNEPPHLDLHHLPSSL